MTRNLGYALLAALAALVVLVSTAVFVGFGKASGRDEGADGPQSGAGGARPASSGSWIGTWAAAPAAAEPGTRNAFADMSVRNVVHTSVGGTRARIHLSNLFGERPLTFTRAGIALAAAPSSPTAKAGSLRRLTFDGRPSVTIPPGEKAVSDAVRLNVPAAGDLLITTYTRQASGPVTFHNHARQTNYAGPGDLTRSVAGTDFTQQSPYWRWVTAVDVWTTEADGAVAVLGDSITDGITSSTGANHRWTDFLAERLRTEPDAPRYSVLNAGISGNRVLIDGLDYSPNNGPSALNRLDRDALSRTGVEVLVVELGLNDLLKHPQQLDSARIVAGLQEITRRAHARGVRVVGGTLTPSGGHRGYEPREEAVRQAVNDRIRSGDVFDAVIDFDAALRDPAAPQRLRGIYDSGDHLHPSDNGYRAMAHAVELGQLAGDPDPARL
ncbi:SGNH/GDSL hydrolase family protein [Streptomyces sp. RKND-216]|uniref:SGNH/GDSL hydrolase family protein n=1 Tax=Streptomyces sp. RKND-216 TaxID=2562581 RepID=UPI00109D8681|nr:SGNH/GDSL hydrolase family protein [Streptomyces sp. RKND-216]THA26226.1 SGNH/GDSL hydrolase family protein [Streptomyces sp. RKND-216]